LYNVSDFNINFNKKFKEYKEKPKSKRKHFFIGFSTVVGIFCLTLFGPALSTVAKDIPKVSPKPTDIIPPSSVTPPLPPGSEIITNTLTGLAGTVCRLSITSGSFAVGADYGFIIVIGSSYVQGK
jgi:hypothetical protein